MTNGLGTFDVTIIGAGIAGSTLARELARYETSVAVVEKEADVCFGATKGSHAIAHCGIPDPTAPLKSRGELEGNIMMEQLCSELDVPFKRIGKLLIAYNEEEKNIVREIGQKTKDHGVAGVEFIEDRERIKQMEPAVSDEVITALYTPTTGIANPWSLVTGLIENAVDNGVRLFVNTEVLGVTTNPDNTFCLSTSRGPIYSSFVVNASGAHADRIAGMVDDTEFTIAGTRQQRIIMDKKSGGTVSHLVREISGTGAAGNFVMPTVDGNIMVGSKVEPIKDIEDVRTTPEGLNDWVIPRFRRIIPSLDPGDSIRPFAAFIPVAGSEFHIQPSAHYSRFVHLVLGGSGFTSAPAMAKYVAEEVLPGVGFTREKKDIFNPYRTDIQHLYQLDNEKRAQLAARDPLYGKIICRCEQVSEGEILEAVSRGATTRDGVKFRTRAGMGRCQGNFCSHKVIGILSDKLDAPTEAITKRGKGSKELS